MPTYKFKDKTTGKTFKKFMSISECDEFLKENPNIEQLVFGAPLIGYRMTRKKPDSWFRDKLKAIKKNNRGSTVDTI